MWESIVISIVVAVAIFLIIKKTFFTKKNYIDSCKCSCEPTSGRVLNLEPVQLEAATIPEAKPIEKEAEVKPPEAPLLPEKKKGGRKKKVVENA